MSQLVQRCTSESSWFTGCDSLFPPNAKHRSTLCRECKLKYSKELRKKYRFDHMGKTQELLESLPKTPVFRPGIIRIPICVLEPVFAASMALAGRYSRLGNRIELRPFFVRRGSHENHPVVNWFDMETGTSKKELLVTGLWKETPIEPCTPYLSGRIADSPRALRIEIYRQGEVWPAFYAQG